MTDVGRSTVTAEAKAVPRATHEVLDRIETNVPRELLAERRWVAWDRTLRNDGRPTKKPLQASTGREAKSNDPETWTTFGDACAAALRLNRAGGVGFMLAGGPWLGIDLDHVIDRTTGELAPGARQLLDLLSPTYIELSPGGDGLHVFLRGTKGEGWRTKVKDAVGPGTAIEVYDGSDNRYLTVTGVVWSNEPIAEVADSDMQALQALMAARRPKPATPSGQLQRRVEDDDDLERARWLLLQDGTLDGLVDEYDGWIRVLAALRPLGDAGLTLAVAWSQRGQKFVEGDVERRWPGLLGSSVASLFGMADEADRTWRTRCRQGQSKLTKANPADASKPEDPFGGRWFGDLDETWTEQDPPPQRWLVCAQQLRGLPAIGLLARGIVGLLAGAGGIGKTEVMIGLAIAIGTDGLWLDYYPVDDGAGRVLLLAAEEDEAEMRRRVHRLTRRLSPDQRATLRSRLVIAPMHGRSVALLARSSKSGAPERTAFLAALYARLDAEAGSDGWAAILLGPLSRLAGVAIDADNENATALVQALETLTELPGHPTVLVDCHTPATSRRTGQTIEDVRPRGPTGLFDGVRWAAAMHRPKRGAPIEFAVTKANRSPDDLPVIQLERGPDGVLRCTGQAPSAEDRKEQGKQDRQDEYQKDLEARIAHVAPALVGIYKGESVARETIAVSMGRRLSLNRTAVDLAASRGLIQVAGGTLKHPRFAPNPSPNEEGGGPPYTSGRDGTDLSRPPDPVQPRPGTERDGTGRNHDGIDDGQPERLRIRRRKARRKP